jgi:hypothetical protein
MPSAITNCPKCGQPGRWGFDDDWCSSADECRSYIDSGGAAADFELLITEGAG